MTLPALLATVEKMLSDMPGPKTGEFTVEEATKLSRRQGGGRISASF